MSQSILELNGEHLGEKVSITDPHQGLKVSGILFEVTHEADMNASARGLGQAMDYVLGRRETRINLSGAGTLTLRSESTFSIVHAKS